MNQHHFGGGSFPTFDAGDALACDIFGQLRQGGGRGHPGGGEVKHPVGREAFTWSIIPFGKSLVISPLH